jgi:hypothetical protein
MTEQEKLMAKNLAEYLTNQYKRWTTSPDAPPPARGTYASQNEFANWLDIDATHLSILMGGKRFCTRATAEKLSDKLGPRVFDLLGYPRRMPREAVLIRIVEEAADLDNAQREAVLDFIQAKKRKASEPITA